MYAGWEAKFEDWKKSNKDNPDRKAADIQTFLLF